VRLPEKRGLAPATRRTISFQAEDQSSVGDAGLRYLEAGEVAPITSVTISSPSTNYDETLASSARTVVLFLRG